MRDIKFRAWDGTEMRHSGFVINSDGTVGTVTNDEECRNLKIMQFTGLKDCEKKDIYESDIVEPQYNRISPFEVKFGGGKFNISGFAWKECKVIGNIYENPKI